MKGILTAVAILFTECLWADSAIIHQVGLSGSSISGVGASYEILGGRWGTRLTGFMVYSKDSENAEQRTWNLGLEVQRDLRRSKRTRFYLFWGGNAWYDLDEWSHLTAAPGEDPFSDNVRQVLYHERFVDKYLVTGGGVGIGWLFLDHVYTHVDIGSEYRDKVNGPGVTRIGVAGGIGISYRL